MKLQDIQDIEFENFRIDSLTRVSANISLWSLLSRVKPVELFIRDPYIEIHSLKELSPEIKIKKGMAFYINSINITNGNLTLLDPEFTARILAFNLKYRLWQKERRYRLTSPHLEVEFPVQNQQRRFKGAMNAEFEQQEDIFRVKSFNWGPEDLHLAAYGSFGADQNWNLHFNTQGDIGYLLSPILGELSPRGLTYGSIDLTRRDDLISISGLVTSPRISSAGQEFTNLNSRVFWNNKDQKIRVINRFFSTPQLKTGLDVTELPEGVEIQITNARLAKVLKMLDIYPTVPAHGLVRESTFTISGNRLEGSGTVQALPDSQNIQGFNTEGTIDFSHDLSTDITRIQSDRVITPAARFKRIQGSFDPQNTTSSVFVDADVTDLSTLNRYTMVFADLDLSYWNLSRGNGSVQVSYEERPGSSITAVDFDVTNFRANGQAINRLTGTVRGRDSEVTGDFGVVDDLLEGKAQLLSTAEVTRIISPGFKGESTKILNVLDLGWLEINGPVQGSFRFEQKTDEEQPDINCRLQSPGLDFLIFSFTDVSCNLKADYEAFTLSDLTYEYKGGEGRSRIYIDHLRQVYDLEGTVEGIQLSRYTPELSGRVRIEFQADGSYPADPVKIQYAMESVSFYDDRIFEAEGEARLSTDLTDFTLNTTGQFRNADSQSPFAIRFQKEGETYSGNFTLQLNELDLLIPWRDNQGQFILEGEIFENGEDIITASGIGRFNGDTLNFPGFPYTLNNFSGYLTFQDGQFRLNELQGTLGQGTVEMTGDMALEPGKISQFQLSMKGKEMDLYPMDRFRCRINTDLILTLDQERLFLRGNIHFLAADWRKEIDDPIFFITDPVLSSSEDKLLEMLRYDINLTGDQNIHLENSLAKADCRLNLTLRGNIDFPRLSGTIESREGEIYFSNRQFNLINAKLVFTDKLLIDPQVDIKAEGYIKNYRVNIAIDGTADNLKPELSSSPPLPSQDILALISMGELFERPSSEELGARIGSAGMLSLTLTSELQKRAKELLGIDLLEFNPDVSSPLLEGKSYFTIGKSISENFVIIYSTNMSATRKEIWYAKYLLSKNVSLIGMRNEDGNFSLEIRFRKRR